MSVELSSEELCEGRHLEVDCRLQTAFRVGCRGCDVIGKEERDWWEERRTRLGENIKGRYWGRSLKVSCGEASNVSLER